jgi:hypothetical protein
VSRLRAKRPFAEPAAVLAYLSRYTHRVAISNTRLVSMQGESIGFRWKDYRTKGRTRYKTMTLRCWPTYGDNLDASRRLLNLQPAPAPTNDADVHDDRSGEQPRFLCHRCGRPPMAACARSPIQRPNNLAAAHDCPSCGAPASQSTPSARMRTPQITAHRDPGASSNPHSDLDRGSASVPRFPPLRLVRHLPSGRAMPRPASCSGQVSGNPKHKRTLKKRRIASPLASVNPRSCTSRRTPDAPFACQTDCGPFAGSAPQRLDGARPK